MKQFVLSFALVLSLFLRPAHAGDAATITIVDAGKGERTPLRYTWAVGGPATVAMAMEMRIAMKINGQDMGKMPSVRVAMTFDATVEAVDEQGTATIVQVLRTVAVEDAKTKDKKAVEAVAGMREEFGSLVGTSFRSSVSARGATSNLVVTPPEGIASGADKMLRELSRAMEGAIVPLPEEAVGAGALWSTQVSVPAPDLPKPMTRADNVHLRSLKGTAAQLVVDSVVGSEPQTITEVAEGPAVAHLDSLTGRSKGTSTIDLSRGFGSTSSGTSSITMAMRGVMGEATIPLEITIVMGIGMASDIKAAQKLLPKLPR